MPRHQKNTVSSVSLRASCNKFKEKEDKKDQQWW
jgi:hypothetical protein